MKISILTIFDARRERDGRIEKKSMKAVPQMKQKKQREEMGGGGGTKKKTNLMGDEVIHLPPKRGEARKHTGNRINAGTRRGLQRMQR